MHMTGRTLLTQLPAPILVIGPAYSGKSELAMQALAPDQPAVVIGSAPPDEPAFQERLAQLQAMRPGAWTSRYGGIDVATCVAAAANDCRQILIDSVGQWLATVLLAAAELNLGELGRAAHLAQHVSDLIAVLSRYPQHRFVLVTAEIGGGAAPARATERLYRQSVGLCNQRLAQAAQTVLSVQAGLFTMIKG